MIVAQEKRAPVDVPEPFISPRRARALREDKLVLTGLVFLAFVLGLLLVFYYSQVTVVGKELDDLKKELAALRSESEYLEATIRGCSSLGRVELLARHHLGMVEPTRKEVLALAGPLETAQKTAGHEEGAQSASKSNTVIATFTALIDHVGQKLKPGIAAETGV